MGRYKTKTLTVPFPPVPIDPDVQRVVPHYTRSNKPVINVRPAYLLAPEPDSVRESIKDLTADIGDVLTVALYPDTGPRFLKQRYGRGNRPQSN